MQLSVILPPNWMAQNESSGPETYWRQGSKNPFQVSWAKHRGTRPVPAFSADRLKQMAAEFGKSSSFGEWTQAGSGACQFGCFGTAVFRSAKFPRVQVWMVSNGRDIIMATHICDAEPDPDEVAEIQQIAQSLAIVAEKPVKPFWKFW